MISSDAESYFQNYFNQPGAARSPKTNLRQNQFGAVLGGQSIFPRSITGETKLSSCSITRAADAASRALSAPAWYRRTSSAPAISVSCSIA